jgi:hypothetical protein
VQRGKEERTSGAEALVSSAFYGTAEAVPFVKSGFFLDGLISRSAARLKMGRDAILKNLQPSLRDFSMVHANPGLRPGLSSTVPVRQAQGRLYGTRFGHGLTQTLRPSSARLCFPQQARER